MSKKILILIGIVLGLGIILLVGFSLINKPTSNTGANTGGTNFFSNFFPFGKNTNVGNNETGKPANISGYQTPNQTPEGKQILMRVSSMPIAGYGVFMKERFKETQDPSSVLPLAGEEGSKTPSVIPPVAQSTEFSPALRYIEKATGNIFQTFADKIEERKFTTNIIPGIYDAYFGNDASYLIMRYLKDNTQTIESFFGKIPADILGGDTIINNNEITGSFLPENITDISISPDGSSMFYLFNSGNNAFGAVVSAQGDKKTQIFSSPFTEWLSQWPNDHMITITTKPSYNYPGYAYSLDPNTKKITKLMGDINGMTTLTSPNGKLILYNDNTLSLYVKNLDSKDSISLGIKTMPEKCVWNKGSTTIYCAVPKYISGSNYPDIWYTGETSFSDNLWRINVNKGTATDLADPLSFNNGEEIDGVKLSLDEGENYLFFINKKNSYLWELYLK